MENETQLRQLTEEEKQTLRSNYIERQKKDFENKVRDMERLFMSILKTGYETARRVVRVPTGYDETEELVKRLKDKGFDVIIGGKDTVNELSQLLDLNIRSDYAFDNEIFVRL